jgi:hypothetical protein
MKCSNCHRTIDPRSAWKGSAGRFYCSEFCADAEAQDRLEVARRVSKDEIDRHYMERLQKLLPYVRRRSALVPSSSSPGIG